MWDARDWSPKRTLSGHHSGDVRCGAFAPDGGSFVTVSLDGTACVWATASWRRVRTLRGHTCGARWCAFAPSGAALVTVAGDHSVHVWADDQEHLCRAHQDSSDEREEPTGPAL